MLLLRANESGTLITILKPELNVNYISVGTERFDVRHGGSGTKITGIVTWDGRVRKSRN